MDTERLIKESDDFELKRRSEFDSDINIPFAILTVMSGFWYSLAGKLTKPLDGSEVLILVLLVLSGDSIAIAAALLWRAHVGVGYKALASAQSLSDHAEALKKWGAEVGRPESEAAEKFSEYLLQSRIKNAQHNAETNDKRSKRILKQKEWLGIGLLILSVCGIVQVFHSYYFPSEERIQSISTELSVKF